MSFDVWLVLVEMVDVDDVFVVVFDVGVVVFDVWVVNCY